MLLNRITRSLKIVSKVFVFNKNSGFCPKKSLQKIKIEK